jgi:hypothetical protein
MPFILLVAQIEQSVKLNDHSRIVLTSGINGFILILYYLHLDFPNLPLCFGCDVGLIFLDMITLMKRAEGYKLRHATLWQFL